MIATPNRSTAVLMSVDVFDSLQKTMISLAQPGIQEELAQADRDYAAKALQGSRYEIQQRTDQQVVGS